MKGNVQRQTVQSSDMPPPSQASGSGRSYVPLATRVEADPSQASAWQKQSSVRPVQNTAAGAPMHDFNFNAPNSPYTRERTGSSGSQGSYGGTPNQRQSYQTKPGTLGVTS